MQVVLLLAITGAALAVPRNIQRIIGGEDTTIEKYPFMSSMEFGYFGHSFVQSCGGSLISKRFVLSSAHCYVEVTVLQWRVRLGSSYASSGGDEHSVAKIILHSKYDDNTSDNDIALIELATFANIDNVTIAAARMPAASYVLPDDSALNIIGWGLMGYSENSDGDYPEQLQHVEVRSINQKICVERYAYLKSLPGAIILFDVTDRMFCSGILDIGGKDSCQGDSGGPAVHAGDIVVGITSWEHECANGTYPSINTRVSYFSKWIIENTK